MIKKWRKYCSGADLLLKLGLKEYCFYLGSYIWHHQRGVCPTGNTHSERVVGWIYQGLRIWNLHEAPGLLFSILQVPDFAFFSKLIGCKGIWLLVRNGFVKGRIRFHLFRSGLNIFCRSMNISILISFSVQDFFTHRFESMRRSKMRGMHLGYGLKKNWRGHLEGSLASGLTKDLVNSFFWHLMYVVCLEAHRGAPGRWLIKGQEYPSGESFRR